MLEICLLGQFSVRQGSQPVEIASRPAQTQVSQALLDRLVAAQRWSDARQWAEHWITRGQAPEPAYRALMQAQAALGDHGALAAAFQRCLDALQRELRVEPSQQTRALFEGPRRAGGPTPAAGAETVAQQPVTARAPRAATGAPLPPVEAADYQAAMDELRRIFLEAGQSGTALQAAWRAGRALAAGDIEALARGPSTV